MRQPRAAACSGSAASCRRAPPRGRASRVGTLRSSADASSSAPRAFGACALDGRAHAVVRDGREAGWIQPRRRLLRASARPAAPTRARRRRGAGPQRHRALGGAAAAHGARRDDAQVAGPEAVVPRQQGRRPLAAAARLRGARPAGRRGRAGAARTARPSARARVLEPLVGPLLAPLLRHALLLLALVRQRPSSRVAYFCSASRRSWYFAARTAALACSSTLWWLFLRRLEAVGECANQCECFEILVWHCATPACMHRSIPLEDGNAGSNSLHRLVCCATHPLLLGIPSVLQAASSPSWTLTSNDEQAVNGPALGRIYDFFELKIMQSILCSLLARLGSGSGVHARPALRTEPHASLLAVAQHSPSVKRIASAMSRQLQRLLPGRQAPSRRLAFGLVNNDRARVAALRPAAEGLDKRRLRGEREPEQGGEADQPGQGHDGRAAGLCGRVDARPLPEGRQVSGRRGGRELAARVPPRHLLVGAVVTASGATVGYWKIGLDDLKQTSSALPKNFPVLIHLRHPRVDPARDPAVLY